ncbi:MAG: hypothetical protein JSV79_12245 [Armatimonadota bacterium]|nr:MAG: hypothetical protein JSV79_12245 [Armatimonadota bacterium]
MKGPVEMEEDSLTERVRALRAGLMESQGEFHEWFALWAESVAQTEGEPMILRRAKAFAHLLDHMAIELPRGALIVGRHPKTVVDDETRERLMGEWRRTAKPPEDREIHFQDEGLFRSPVIALHIAPDGKKVLDGGFDGLASEIRGRLREVNETGKREFYAAALMCVEAASRFVERCGRLAAEAAAGEECDGRRGELERVSEICARVAHDPPDSFWGALQLAWFVYLLVNLESGPNVGQAGPGCLDRWLIEHYRRDVEAGRVTPGRALELVECFLIEMNASLPRGGILPLAIGGLGADGKGAENELTWLFLKGAADLRLLHPSLALRYHRRIPQGMMGAALRSIGSGSTYPAFFNDEVCVESLRGAGVSEGDSLEWVHSICTELTAVGRTYAWIAAPYLNLVKCLELALNGGRCLLTGRELGEDLGDLTRYGEFEELYSAYRRQVAAMVKAGVAAAARNKQQVEERRPCAFLSCLTEDCIERGLEYARGGARYNPDYVHGIGISTAADSLAAIRRLVFETGEVSAEVLLAALRSDFEGFEALRQRLMNKAPKYGNDDDEADAMFVRLVQDFYEEVEGRTDGRGGKCYPGFMTWESHNLLGKGTGASADGRRARAAVSDSVGAVQGMDRKGLTALLRSVTKADYVPAVGGVTFNVKVSPELFRSEEGVSALEAALRTYLDAGGFQVQVNVLRPEQLAEAKEHPERHGNLMVRVGGFSAYFVELDPGLQDEIIARTAHQ